MLDYVWSLASVIFGAGAKAYIFCYWGIYLTLICGKFIINSETISGMNKWYIQVQYIYVNENTRIIKNVINICNGTLICLKKRTVKINS